MEVRRAHPRDADRLADVLGRALVTEPMMTWPLGGRPDELESRCIRTYAVYLEPLLESGMVWTTGDGRGAMVLVGPDQSEVWEAALAHVEQSGGGDATDDGGQRHERFWSWVAARVSPGPAWHLDTVAVEPGWQGRGIGSALIGSALDLARESGTPVVLETGTARNVPLYERSGFRIVDEADSPDGGPHVWFLRWDA